MPRWSDALLDPNDLAPEELPGLHRYGWLIVSILRCGSLPACYALAKGRP